MRSIKFMRFYGMMHFWLGIQYDFVSDCFIIGLLFIYIRIPKAVGHYTYGPTQQKLSSTSGVIDKNELVMPGAYVDMYVAPERTDAFGLISGKITARDKQVIDACNNHGHGAAECAGTVPLK